ncbi:unnamed protein product [Musa textilis]
MDVLVASGPHSVSESFRHPLLSFHIPHIEEEIAQISKSYPKRVRVFFSSLIVLLGANLLPMKPAVSVMFLLFLVLLLSANRSQGARVLEEESLAPLHRQVHEKESMVKEESGVPGELLLRGSHGDLSGKSRKLMANAKATSKSGKRNDVGADSAQKNQKHSKDEADSSQDGIHTAPPASKRPPSYPDILDIAGMDYSPAKRKPPIHN